MKKIVEKTIKFTERVEASATLTTLFFIAYFLLTLIIQTLPFQIESIFKLWVMIALIGALVSYFPWFSEEISKQ